MKRIASSLAALAMGLGMAQGAQAVTVAFPDAGATIIQGLPNLPPCGPVGCFWALSLDHSVRQIIDGGAGLTSVNHALLDVDVVDITLDTINQVLDRVDWEVSVNGTVVGTWSVLETDSPGTFSNDFDFGAIGGLDLGVGAAGSNDYELLLRVINEVPSGDGSVQLGGDGTVTLDFVGAPGVPEPASLALLGLGLLGLGVARRRFV